jgi:hypothetical protein
MISDIENDGMFYDKPIKYWFELDRQAKNLNYDKLIDEITQLRAEIHILDHKLMKARQFINDTYDKITKYNLEKDNLFRKL